tara:strand:+ start:40 stop:561 length:522 start_codon:yes stop_codon:yes gene_type:complete
MSADWYKRQIKNRNYLSPLGFKLELELFDGVDFFCQQANIPEITMPVTQVPTRYRSVPIVPGGGVTFGDFSVQFIIDEDLVNYNSIQKWIRRNGNDGGDSTIVPGEPEYSDGRLMITTSNYQVQRVIVFKGLFPISITSVPFDATVTDQEYFTANVVFKYHNYMITDVNFNEL